MSLITTILYCSLLVTDGSDSVKRIQSKDQKIQAMVQKHTESQTGKIKGFRVQIHFGAEKSKALQIKSKFLSRFPEVRAYDPYDAPYFKIRVGDFRTKLEAYKFLKSVQAEFPGSFIVTDEIELPPL